MIKFGDYLPDQPDLGNSVDIKNAIPDATGYRSFPGLTVFSSALGSRCQGAVAVKDTTGNVYNYAGDADFLYSLVDTSFTSVVTTVTANDISFSAAQFIRSVTTDLTVFSNGQKIRVSGTTSNNLDLDISLSTSITLITVDQTTITTESRTATTTIKRLYSTDGAERWEFVQWKDTVIATNFADPPQSISIGGSAFGDLAGGPPKAKHVGIVADFVVFGNVDESGTRTPNKLVWSALGNELSYTADAATQADFQVLVGAGGDIQHVSPGETGYVFQEYSIWTMNYVGSPDIFQFNEVEVGRGTPAPASVARIGRFAFYLGQDGFYYFDGVQSHPIGAEKVDRTFYADLDTEYYDRVTGAIDPVNHLVLWSYPGAGSTGGAPDTIIFYNWVTQKWGYCEINTQIILRSFSTGYTLDGLDAVNASLDALPFSLDSRAWQGGALLMSAFDSSNKLSNFDGAALTASIETPEMQHFENQRANVVYCRVQANSFSGTASVTLQIATRDQQKLAKSWSSAYSENGVNGIFDVRENGRYHTYRAVIANDFDNAIGVEVEAVPAGKR